jgi:Phage portal protein, SPP1 Gp6-like.
LSRRQQLKGQSSRSLDKGRNGALSTEQALKSQGERIMEQVNPALMATNMSQEDYYWGRLATGAEEDYYWRRLSDDFTFKDVVPATYLELHNQCYEAWNANPLAAAIIEMTTSFVLGKGVLIEAAQRKVQRVLDAFWHDPANRMEERVYNICQELALYGETFVRFYVNRYDGTVKIRMIDPSLIDQIECEPEDIETPLRFHRRALGQLANSTMGQLATSAGNANAQINMEGEWFHAGSEVVQFTINKVSHAKRGRSDLATLLPWLRRYKDWLTDRVRINKYKSVFLWDVQLTGADRKTIDRKRMDYSYPPEPGSVIIHNEAEKWSAVQPGIRADDASADGRAIKLMIAVGAGLPEHYLADGAQGNRATAAEMGLPTLLKFQRRQQTMKYVLRTILNRVIVEAQHAGKLSKQADTSFDIVFPEIDVADHQTQAMAVKQLVDGLAQARQQDWISDDTAMRLIFQAVDSEIDVHSERAAIQRQQQEQPPI